jgi:hypothetical protein
MKVRKYSDGRWGFDDYSSGKRRMVRVLSKEKAMTRVKANQLTTWEQIDPIQMKEFQRWQSIRTMRRSLCNDGRRKHNGMTEAERIVCEYVHSWEGFVKLKSGWPDFLVAHADSIYCLEVKTGNDPIRNNQKRMHEILRKVGIETFIVRDGWCEQLQKRFAPSRKLYEARDAQPDH